MPRASDRVHDALRADIVEGRLAPGDPVPSERALAEQVGVNRHAVREALKRLEQAGLVRISQGGATRVLDWREGAGLDVLLDLAGGPDAPLELARDVLEMRASIGVDAARRCAERAPDRAAVAVAAREAAALVGGDPEALDDAYAALWRRIVDGSGNVAYRLALNSLVAALDAHPEVAGLVRPGDAAGIEALGTAIERGDPVAAAERARALLEGDLTTGWTSP
jgi:GntR family transcriptional regulator, transcriptional repressor for pyruvate dehydrogenase complex